MFHLSDRDTPASGWRRWLLLALALLLLLSIAGLALALVEKDRSEARSTRSDREAVSAATAEYARLAWTFDDADLDAKKTLSRVVDRAEPAITTAFRPTYQDLVTQLTPTLAGKQISRLVSRVDTVGVDSLEDDTAMVIADVDATRFAPSGKSESARVLWVLTLKKIDGDWRVDKHEDLTSGQPKAQQPGGAQ
ncbi:MAG: hypothetical protein L0H93_15445 [Nocardioides sp.]|nr:hypothetical protein [Nocardioides sp.]